MDYNNNNLPDDEYYFLQGLSKEDIKNMEIDETFVFKKYEYSPPFVDSAKDDDFVITPSPVKDEVKPQNKQIKELSGKDAEIHKHHRERVRKKFLKTGLSGFSDIEALEMLLFYSIKRKDTNVLAHNLINRFGSLQNVLNAEYCDLIEVDGISEVSATLIVFYRELNKFIRTSPKKEVDLSTSVKVGEFCCDYFYNHVEENLILISMDATHKLKCVDVISCGSETETAYYPRKVMKAVIKNRANEVVIAHNHPGGILNPSSNDMVITEKLSSILQDVGIGVVDHIVCCGDKYYSLSERGMMKF